MTVSGLSVCANKGGGGGYNFYRNGDIVTVFRICANPGTDVSLNWVLSVTQLMEFSWYSWPEGQGCGDVKLSCQRGWL